MSDDADAEAEAASARRRTWVIGGILLLLSVLVLVVARGPLAAIAPAKDWLFAAAGVIFAVGLGRAGSVTGRGIIGTASTILCVIAPLTQAFWFGLVPDTLDPNAEEDLWTLVLMAYLAVATVLALISVFCIGLAAVIPSPWHWAPAWVVVWTPVAYLAGLFVFSSQSPEASLGAYLASYGPAAGTAFLGILSIVLGLRAWPAASESPGVEQTLGGLEASDR